MPEDRGPHSERSTSARERHLVVAVDGPSGSGKSTVSRRVAREFGLRYLDTGAMYRALTWAVLRAGVNPTDPDTVREVAATARLEPTTDPDAPSIRVDGHRVDGPIRGPDVTAAVSAVSAVPEVRQRLVAEQQSIIGAGGIVVEGRDIGSVVAPHAEVKVFLTAAPDTRAERRAQEITVGDEGGEGQPVDRPAPDDRLATVRGALAHRDRQDSNRVVGPLLRARDAVLIDSTHHEIDEVVALIIAQCGTALDNSGAASGAAP